MDHKLTKHCAFVKYEEGKEREEGVEGREREGGKGGVESDREREGKGGEGKGGGKGRRVPRRGKVIGIILTFSLRGLLEDLEKEGIPPFVFSARYAFLEKQSISMRLPPSILLPTPFPLPFPVFLASPVRSAQLPLHLLLTNGSSTHRWIVIQLPKNAQRSGTYPSL
jgi:hypothetical protein